MSKTENIRNFSIIAHIDHGKSTLADRMLEITGAVEKRKMRDQVLDDLELEQERGITIKMRPASMFYKRGEQTYTLNLIDTPGHVDFAYEVSRALSAVEGVVLLVDATQGVEAQTLSVLAEAKKQGLVIIPALSKVDSPLARTDEIAIELALMLDVDESEIIKTSGKTGEGVKDLLDAIVDKIPAPKDSRKKQALVFDFQYSEHKGIILYVRIFGGEFKKGDNLKFIAANEKFIAQEVGIFTPEEKSVDSLSAGEIGYIVSGVKKPGIVHVGDTVSSALQSAEALPGYKDPEPVIWASVYPESQDDFDALRQALLRMKLLDSSISFEEESNGVLGRGFRVGFLGMLHLEIVIERLKREFGLELIVTSPTTLYKVKLKNKDEEQLIYSPIYFPDHGDIEYVLEEWVKVHIIAPPEYTGAISQLLLEHEAEILENNSLADGRTETLAKMPLRELMRNFFDKLKNISSGFASLSYEKIGFQPAEVTRMDVLIADEVFPAFSKIVSKFKIKEEAKAIVKKLYEELPRQQFVLKIQAKALGKIIASERKSALRKDVTAKLYGGDVTRKMKLLEKQKKGKKKLLSRGKVHIPQETFLKVLKN